MHKHNLSDDKWSYFTENSCGSTENRTVWEHSRDTGWFHNEVILVNTENCFDLVKEWQMYLFFWELRTQFFLLYQQDYVVIGIWSVGMDKRKQCTTEKVYKARGENGKKDPITGSWSQNSWKWGAIFLVKRIIKH